MKKTAYFALGSMAALAVLVVGVLATSAASTGNQSNPLSQGMGGRMMRGEKIELSDQQRTQMEEHRVQMDEFMQPGNYDAWKATMEEFSQNKPGLERKMDVITEENFDQFVQMHTLMKSGDTEGAKAIAEELGLPQFGPGMGMKHFGKGPMKDSNGDGVCDRTDV